MEVGEEVFFLKFVFDYDTAFYRLCNRMRHVVGFIDGWASNKWLGIFFMILFFSWAHCGLHVMDILCIFSLSVPTLWNSVFMIHDDKTKPRKRQ